MNLENKQSSIELSEFSGDDDPERESYIDDEDTAASNFTWATFSSVMDKPTDRWNPKNYQPTEYELYLLEESILT
jgi:hypothetical protein